MDNFDPETQAIERRRQMAQMLLQQSQQSPQGRMVGRVFVGANPLEYLAQGLKGYSANQQLNQADTAQQDLQKTRQEATKNDMAGLIGALRGKPAQTVQPLTPNDDEGNVNPPIEMPAQAADMGEAYRLALASKNPQLQQFGMQGLAQMPAMAAQKAEREESRTFRQQEAEANRAARMEELNLRIQDGQRSQQERLQAQKELREMQIQASKDNARFIASMRQPPQAQIIQTDTGPMQLVGGKAVPILGPDNKPVAGKPVGGAAAASTGAKVKDAQDALATIGMAEKLIDKATGSGIGSAIDSTAAFFGKSTEGAQAAAQLKALEGDLVSKMPKMSGPQSDKDVLLYKQMAGQIGDPSIPQETKKAALATIKEMQKRYAGVEPTGSWETPASAPKFLGFEK